MKLEDFEKYKNIQEENKELKEELGRIKNKYKRLNKNLQKENNELKEKINKRDKQFHDVQVISQEFGKTLRELGLEIDNNDGGDSSNYSTLLPSWKIALEAKKAVFKVSETTNSTESDFLTTGSAKHSWDSLNEGLKEIDIRIVVGLYFGTKYSGFAYCHIGNPKKIFINNQWPGDIGNLMTNTTLQYDSNLIVKKWGKEALCDRSKSNKYKNKNIILHLGDLLDSSNLPKGLNYKRVITDYFREIGKVIKESIASQWPSIDFLSKVLLILTIPVSYDISIIKECVHQAGLIRNKDSNTLQIVSTSEAIANYCMENLYSLTIGTTIGTTFMIVNCGNTVNLTAYKLIKNQKLSEITKDTGDLCGNIYIDREFVNFLSEKIGTDIINYLKNNYNNQFQNIIHKCLKLPFEDNDTNFCYELDLEEVASSLLNTKHISKETKEFMKKNDWLIEIKYNDIKNIFDPVVDKIIRLIRSQLSSIRETCSTIFLIGDFSESTYLQYRIKQEFQNTIKNISVPHNPMAAIVRGAVIYGSLYNNNSTDF